MEYTIEEQENTIFSSEELQEMEYAFSKYAIVSDKEKDPQGVISADDLQYLLRSIGVTLTEGEVFTALDEFDPKQTGIIDYNTFLQIVRKNLVRMTEDDLRLCFAVFDKDVNGHIATQEIRQVTFHLGQKYTDEEIDDMLREVDADGDGRISFDDFVYFMTKH